MKVACLRLQRAVDSENNYKGILPKDKEEEAEKLGVIIAILIEFINWCVEVSPAFIHFWTDALNESFLNEIKAIS